jgi:hypothetical protein
MLQYIKFVVIPLVTSSGVHNKSIFAAIRAGRSSALGSIVQRKADVNGHDESGLTPLMLAASMGKVDDVKTLIGLKADVDLIVEDKTALFFALGLAEAKNPRLKPLKLLLFCSIPRRTSIGGCLVSRKLI